MNLNNFHQIHVHLFPKKIYYIQFLFFNSSLPPSVKIGKKSVFGYGGIGVVIHDRAQIGERCVLGQGITIGGRSKKYEVPIIDNNVFIEPGARILGDVIIPAKIIKTNIIPEDYV